MTQVAFLGAVEIGLVYAFVALGVMLSFRVLNFPDLTVDGSFPLGAAVAAVLILAGLDPWLASLAAAGAGALAGLVTAFLNIRFRILHLLASILTMIALYSINLRIMAAPNVAIIQQQKVFSPFLGPDLPAYMVRPLFLAVFVLVMSLLLARFLVSDYGLAMRATGANPRMARAQGVRTDAVTYVGMALSNALVALGGAMFAQTNGFADVTAGVGTIVVGLAAVILGETLIRARAVLLMVAACIAGSILYRIVIQLALNAGFLGLQASDLNLITAVLVGVALILPGWRDRLTARLRRPAWRQAAP